jgi:hypothetical protein
MDDGDNQDDADDLLVTRDKSTDEKQVEEEEYRSWLLSTLKAEENSKTAFRDWVDFQERKRKDLNENDRFLIE